MNKTNAINLVSLLAGTTLLYFGAGYAVEKISPMFKPKPPARPMLPPPPPAPPPSLVPVLMTGPTLFVYPGRRYGASLDTPSVFGATIVSDNMIRKEAARLGFTQVAVSDKAPVGWPGSQKAKADRYVVGFYNGAAPISLPRSEAGLDVLEAWEG